jgi:hypothetical protein
MAKIVNINENDLKRIVKRVLNERKQLNEEPISALAIGAWVVGSAIAAKIGIDTYNWWSSGDARQRASSVFEMCERGGIEGKPIEDENEHVEVAKKYHKACPGTGMLKNCDEDEMLDILGDIQSLPDLCGVIKEFRTLGHGSMWEITESAMDSEEYWEKVNEVLTPAFRKTQEANKKTENQKEQKPGDIKPGGGSNASGEGTVADLQQLLKDKGFDIGDYGVDGKFGSDTLEATLKALRSLK